MSDPKHKSVASTAQSISSSTYSGNSTSVGAATEQSVQKIEGERMTSSAKAAQAKRAKNKAEAERRRKTEQAQLK